MCIVLIIDKMVLWDVDCIYIYFAVLVLCMFRCIVCALITWHIVLANISSWLVRDYSYVVQSTEFVTYLYTLYYHVDKQVPFC